MIHTICINLIQRWHHNEYWHMNFDGLESYLLTNRGARILVNTTHNREHFNGKVISGHSGNIKNLHLKSVGYLVRMKLKIGQNKISFRGKVDKFVGFCANPFIHESKRLNVNFIPRVNIFEQN